MDRDEIEQRWNAIQTEESDTNEVESMTNQRRVMHGPNRMNYRIDKI